MDIIYLLCSVEIILYYLTRELQEQAETIYNSRNYSILLNESSKSSSEESTTVEIILYYLTNISLSAVHASTTVEIILYYLTRDFTQGKGIYLQQ